MSLELECVAATIVGVKPKKKTKADDAPLTVVIDFSLDICANLVLPYFDPALRHFLFNESGVRFPIGLGAFKWNQSHNLMEIKVLGFTLQASTVGKYRFNPYAKLSEEDADFRDCVFLGFTATVDIPKENSPLALLCEMLNSEVEISMHPSQLKLDEMQEEQKKSIVVNFPGADEEQKTLADLFPPKKSKGK